MREFCNCPCCRHGAGELTDREYAWYLKGCIEMAASIPKELIEKWKSKTATKAERDFEMDLWTEDSANRIYLKELIAHMEERREHVDKAFLYPEDHRYPEEKRLYRFEEVEEYVETVECDESLYNCICKIYGVDKTALMPRMP